MRVAAGTRIAERYVVLDEIGAGGMGVVLRARDERLGRLVAVKLLPADAIGDEGARKRLVREARSAAALDHPGIVHVYDVGESTDGGAFLVMELVPGKSLGDHLREGTLSMTARVRAIVEIARALAYAHGRGLLHRDIKPDNVMVREDGRAVILDFGLAKAVLGGLGTTVDASLVSTSTSFVGTPAYVSPEQARGEELGPATDQFSLAVSAFEALTGELPWEGKTPLEVISEILRAAPRKLRQLAPDLPAAVEVVLERALAKNERDRFPSLDAFADAFDAAWPLEAQPTVSAPSSIARDVAPSRSRASRLAAVVLAVVALASGVFVLSHRPKPAPVPAAPALGPKAVVACPVLRATAAGETETGWLGAAAATLVCNRIQMAMGGSADRTRIPAELLDLPRQPGEGFPEAPYEGDAAARSLERAKTFDAWIEGGVEYATDFHVSLALHTKNGVLAQGDARGTILLDAIRGAMGEILLRLPVEEEYAAKWFPGVSSRARVELIDLHTLVLNEDSVGVAAHCDQLEKRTDLGSLTTLAATICATERLRKAPPPPPYDASSPAAQLTTSATLRFERAQGDTARATQLERAKKLGEAAKAESSGPEKALLLAGQAEIFYTALADNEAAGNSARGAILAWPKVIDVRGDPWHRLSFVSAFNKPVLTAHAAWVPWEPFAQANMGRFSTPSTAFRHAYVLAHRGYWAVEYGVHLLELQQVEAAREVAAATGNQRLEVLVLVASRKPGEALRTATEALKTMPASPENGGEAARLSSMSIELAIFMGRPTDEIARTFIERFLDADPPALTHGASTFFGALAVCLGAPRDLGRTCLSRVSALFDAGYFGGATTSSREALRGAKQFLDGDLTGAAMTWRPVTGDLLAVAMRTPLSLALERAGDVRLLDHLDDRAIAQGQVAPDIELAYVRKALRAQKRGDYATARKLAQAFVDRWEEADEIPPGVAQMNAILARAK